MSAYLARNERFRREYGISQAAYYKRRKEGLSHSEAIKSAQMAARHPYKERTEAARAEVAALMRRWRR